MKIKIMVAAKKTSNSKSNFCFNLLINIKPLSLYSSFFYQALTGIELVTFDIPMHHSNQLIYKAYS